MGNYKLPPLSDLVISMLADWLDNHQFLVIVVFPTDPEDASSLSFVLEKNETVQGRNRRLEATVFDLRQTIERLQQNNQQLTESNSLLRNSEWLKDGKIKSLEATVSTQQSTIEGLEATVSTQKSTIEGLEATVSTQQSSIEGLEASEQVKEDKIKSLQATVEKLEATVSIQESIIGDLSVEVNHLTQELRTLKDEYAHSKLLHFDEIRNLNAGHTTELNVLRARHTTELNVLRADVVQLRARIVFLESYDNMRPPEYTEEAARGDPPEYSAEREAGTVGGDQPSVVSVDQPGTSGQQQAPTGLQHRTGGGAGTSGGSFVQQMIKKFES